MRKVAFLSESPVDEAALHVLVEGILEEEIEVAARPETPRGWQAVFNYAPNIINHLYYRTDVEALVISLDSDVTTIHVPGHEVAGAEDADCRLCQLRAITDKVLGELVAFDNRGRPKFGLGLAVPAIEAWYVFSVDQSVSESRWKTQMGEKKYSYDKQWLKRKLYGSDRAPMSVMKEKAVQAAQQLVSNDLKTLEQYFPGGFGCFAKEVRGWKISSDGNPV